MSTSIPAYVGKFLKMAPAARKALEPRTADGRVCHLDPQDHRRVLVFASGPKPSWDEMNWTQERLYEEAMRDTTLRVSRKKISCSYLEINQEDLFNEPERSLYADKPNMGSSLASTQLGWLQTKRHEYVYILSRKEPA